MKGKDKFEDYFTNHETLLMEEEFHLMEDLQQHNCPVCNHMEQIVFDILLKWQYALTVDEKTQREYAAELGFCAVHTWQLATMSSRRGISLGHQKLLEHLAEELLRSIDATINISEGIEALVKDSAGCRICHLLKNMEETYVHHLATILEQDEARDIYARSHGVCLRHLSLLVSSLTSQKIVRFLLSETAKHLKETAEDMQRYVLKHETLQRHLISQDERYAYLRALVYMVGARNVCAPHIRCVE